MASPHASAGTPIGAVRADQSSFERVRLALEHAGGTPRPRGTTHLDARCPAHEDHRPSLSVDWRDTPDKGGATFVCCQTGCPGDAVVAALGLSLAELFDSWEPRRVVVAPPARKPAKQERGKAAPAVRQPRPRRGWPAAGELTAVYRYERSGELVGEVGRFVDRDGKTFRWRRPVEGRPGFWLHEKPADVPLYRQDDLRCAVDRGEPVYIVEGEKDADAAAGAGAVAVSKANGACKRAEEWRPEWTAALAGAQVLIVADRDEAGYRHAAIVATAVAGPAASVRVVRTPLEHAKADLSDHLAAGLPLDRLEPVPAELLPAVAPPATGPGPGGRVLPFPPRTGGGPGGPPGGGDGGAGGAAAPNAPRRRIPMSQGSWKYSTGDDDGYARGVYRHAGREDADAEWSGWALVAPLPYVLERLTRRDGDGRRTGLAYRLATSADGADAVVCDGDEVRQGEWAARLDLPLSADDKIVKAAATAVRDVAARAPAREMAPRWVDGTLHMPPPDVGPKGYGDMTADGDAARQAWREIGAIAAGNPKVALALGTALGGPFVDPLKRQPFVFLMVGDSSQGKTSGLLAAGAMFGDPEHVVQPWSTSPIGLPAELGELATLPAFRDELGASGLSPAALEALLFRLTQGVSRTVGKRTGGARRSAAWRAPFLSTGNVGVLGRMANEGIAARVIEVSTPIVATRDEAERLEALARCFYGWPLAWLLESGVTVAEFAEAVERAESELGIAGGGVPRRLGRHVALAVAGAGLFEDLVGVGGVREAAASAAVTVLDGLVAELLERGIRPGERLLSAVVQAAASRPAAFPTKLDYQRAADGVDGYRLPSAVEGFTLDAPAGEQRVAVLTTHMDAIAASAGMDDCLPALRQLREDKLLVTSGESDGRLRGRERVGKWRPSVYVFRIVDEPLPDQEPPAPVATPSPVPPAPAAAPEPAEVQSSTPTEQEEQGDEVLPVTGPARPAGAHVQAAVAVLALRAAHLVIPGMRRQVAMLPDPAATSLPDLLAWGERMGLGLPDPSGLRKLRDDGQLWLLRPIATVFGLPAAPPAGGSAAARELHARVAAELEPHGWKLGARAFFAEKGKTAHWWVNVYREGGAGLRLVLPHWSRPSEDCPLLRDGEQDHAELAGRLAAYIEHTGTAWSVSSAVSGQNLIERTRARASKRLAGPVDAPPPALDRTMAESDIYWQRPPTPAEAHLRYVQAFDKNGMRLSGMGATWVGLGEAEHRPEWEFDPKVPAYCQIDPPTWDRDMMPNPFDPTSRGRTGPIWLTTHSLDQARREGWWDGRVLQAYVWPAVEGQRGKRPGVRYFEQAYELLRDARERIYPLRATDPDAAAVDVALKATYTGALGKYGAKAAEGDTLYRPDFLHHVIGLSRSNLLRTIVHVARASGRYPLAVAIDCVLYASDQEDPAAAAAELGTHASGPRAGRPIVELDPVTLAAFKPAGTAPMAAVAPLLRERAPRLNRSLMALFEEA